MATSCPPVSPFFVEALEGLSATERERISAAAGLSGDETGRRAALALYELGIDATVVAAALVARGCAAGELDTRRVASEVGHEAGSIAGEVARCRQALAAVRMATFEEADSAQAENLRRLVLSCTDDFRALLVLLAEWLVTVRCVRDEPAAEQERIAHEAMVLYSPLANRLGIGQWKSELEDQAFRILRPTEYHRIARFLDERLGERQQYLDMVKRELRATLAESGIMASVHGRPKHIYSIWKKSLTKGRSLEQLFDLRAVRILVTDIAECYAALGVVHALWEPLPGEFDDYIARPKPNLYRSLHTAVRGPEEKIVEVQIRTHAMHEHAEYGIAAHWRYKEGVSHDPALQEKLSALRSRIDGAPGTASEAASGDEPGEQVYVLTPQGQVLALPAGATVLDFAYRVHTEVGHRARGARVNGKLVPLSTVLATGDRVEILTRKEAAPSRDWLRRDAGFLRTTGARAKVRQWFRAKDFNHYVAQGKETVRRELVRNRRQELDFGELAARFGHDDESRFLAAVGRGEISTGQLASELEQEPREQVRLRTAMPIEPPSGDVLVMGEDDLLTQIAGCCRPVPGDPIVGYLTKGRGITVHRRDCPNMRAVPEHRRDRIVDVSWGRAGRRYAVELKVDAEDREGLLRDVTQALSNARYDIQSVQGHSRSGGHVRIRLTVGVTGQEDVERIRRLLEGIPGIRDICRSGGD